MGKQLPQIPFWEGGGWRAGKIPSSHFSFVGQNPYSLMTVKGSQNPPQCISQGGQNSPHPPTSDPSRQEVL